MGGGTSYTVATPISRSNYTTQGPGSAEKPHDTGRGTVVIFNGCQDEHGVLPGTIGEDGRRVVVIRFLISCAACQHSAQIGAMPARFYDGFWTQ
jgi:hypothetical protein